MEDPEWDVVPPFTPMLCEGCGCRWRTDGSRRTCGVCGGRLVMVETSGAGHVRAARHDAALLVFDGTRDAELVDLAVAVHDEYQAWVRTAVTILGVLFLIALAVFAWWAHSWIEAAPKSGGSGGLNVPYTLAPYSGRD